MFTTLKALKSQSSVIKRTYNLLILFLSLLTQNKMSFNFVIFARFIILVILAS